MSTNLVRLQLTARSPDDLLSQLRGIDIAVPPRGSLRTTEHVERWSIARCLASLARSSALHYPIMVTHTDRPDLQFTMDGVTVGVEITEAVPEDWARVVALRECEDFPECIPIPRFIPGEPRRSLGEIRALASGEDAGDGWAGDGVETDWAQAMAYFIRQKAVKTQSAEFQLFDRKGLLIYDGWPLPDVDLQKAARYLSSSARGQAWGTAFDEVYIESHKHLLWCRRNLQEITFFRIPVSLWS